MRIEGILLIAIAAMCPAQTFRELQDLQIPRSLGISSDGLRLRYKLGELWWEIGTNPNSRAKMADGAFPNPRTSLPEGQVRSSDGKHMAYIGRESTYGAQLLMCRCDGDGGGKPRVLSRIPVSEFQWADNSGSLWVIAANGADRTVGRLHLDGRFEPLTQEPAARRTLVAANGVLAWVQSEGRSPGTIWLKEKNGRIRPVVNPNPQVERWSRQWTQEVIRWKNAHGEELQGVLATPVGGRQLPVVVDPYSSWANRFLTISALGNYAFVQAGFGVFFPDHRAPHGFPEVAFGEAYVGAAKNRDPVDVLLDDVMTGIDELVRRGIADPKRLFLYSSSNGASAINQLIMETRTFRAAVSHGGVADWLGYYHARHPLGDNTIPGFLGGRRPEDSLDLYVRISPAHHVEKITTPLILLVGEKDTRHEDTVRFHQALRKAGKQVELVVYPGQGHEISDAKLAEQHVRRAIQFFRSFQFR